MRSACLTAALFLLLPAACNRPRTQIVVGVITNLSAPDVLDQVSMKVMREGVPLLSHDWDLPGRPAQAYELPGSYGIYSADGSEPRVEVSLVGLKQGREVLRRQSIFSLAKNQTLFTRMALVQSCETVGCPDKDSQTCVEGKCVPMLIQSTRFPLYVQGMDDKVMCRGQTVFVHTGNKSQVPLLNPAKPTCSDDEECIEGTCYKRENLGEDKDGGSTVDEDMRAGVDLRSASDDLGRFDLPPINDLTILPADMQTRFDMFDKDAAIMTAK
jgi:hypothetical protein